EGDPPLVLKTGSTKHIDRELEYYKKIGDHPNIARCLGKRKVGEETGLVMESLSGGDMDGAVKNLQEALKTGKVKQEEFWGVMQYALTGMLRGLEHIHERGFMHSDIKPENLMFDSEGNVKLIDMGGAIEEGRESPAYTPGYVAPEGTSGDKR